MSEDDFNCKNKYYSKNTKEFTSCHKRHDEHHTNNWYKSHMDNTMLLKKTVYTVG